MTAEERSLNDLRRLSAEVDADLQAVERVVKKATELHQRVTSPPTDPECMALAGYLHHFYTGLEGIFERIALAFEGSVPGGIHWHRDLKQSMGLEIKDVRPAILSTAPQK